MVEFYMAVEEEKAKETVEKYYHNGLEWVEPGEKIKEAAKIMKQNSYPQLPVIEHGKNVGRITEPIIMNAKLRWGEGAGEKQVRGVMGPPFPEFDISTSKKDALYILKRVEAILIKKESRIVGILTRNDLL